MRKARNSNLDVNSREEGSIEAGLTLIPTTAFFLLVLQLVVAGSMQTFETMNLQSLLNRRALYAVDGEVPGRVLSSPLPGGGELLLADVNSNAPSMMETGSELNEEKEMRVSLQAVAIRE